ncbi:MAG TPA: sugar ABC transporter substrate-binding protein, partial [Spirochaetia bacterium]|nr:sugar ABC transporter substrate-binding protein [Spirochaetia bacterium]
MKKLLAVLLIALAVTPVLMAQVSASDIKGAGSIHILLWTKEGESDQALQWVKAQAAAFSAQYPDVTFEVINKDVEKLRQDFQTASLA